MTDHIRNHIRAWLAETGTGVTALENRAGCAHGVIGKILRGETRMSRKTLRKLAPHVNWPDECVIEVQGSHDAQQEKARRAQRIKPFCRRQRVAEHKAEPHISARAWG